jgi:N6-L-threonylcarbamoyladenine synthase
MGRLILGIDTSCDDTGVGVVEDAPLRVRANAVRSQLIHQGYGGVVPELASRSHLDHIAAVAQRALDQAGCRFDQFSAVAVTAGPGLLGALLVGLNFAKGLAQGLGLPLLPVHHLQGHLAAGLLEVPHWAPPFLALIVSGGHTHLFDVAEGASGWHYQLLGATLDDAAGEVLDKIARLLGLGFPGGAALARLAEAGDPRAVPLPRPYRGGLDFSFSGLKTAALLAYRAGCRPEDLAAALQARVVEALIKTLRRAAHQTGRSRVVVAGGVAASAALRAALAELPGLEVSLPPPGLNTDNGAMIALAAAGRDAPAPDPTLGCEARAEWGLGDML